MESLARFEVIFPPGTEDEEPATEATDCQSFSLEMLYVYVTEKISLQNFQIQKLLVDLIRKDMDMNCIFGSPTCTIVAFSGMQKLLSQQLF